MRILIILLIFLFINNCSNQNFRSFLKKQNDDQNDAQNGEQNDGQNDERN